MICTTLLALTVGWQEPFFIGRAQADGATEANAAIPQTANEVRAYDLRALRVSSVTAPGSTWRLVPQGLVHILNEGNSYDDSDGEESELFFPGLLSDLLGEQLSFEGRSLRVLEDGTMLLIGPAELQANVQRLYDFFLEAASERIVLSVEVESGGKTTRQLVSLPSAVWGQVRVTETQPIVADVDVQIAQASGIGEPIVVGVESGLRLDLQAVPVDGGVVLSSILRLGQKGSFGQTKIGLGLRVSGETKTGVIVEDFEELQSYELVGLGSGGATFLPDSGSLRLGGVYRNQLHRVTITHVGGQLLPRREVEIQPGGQKLVLLNEHAGAPSRISAQGGGMIPNLERSSYSATMGSSPLLGVRLSQGPGPEVMDLIGSLGLRRKMMISHFGPWRVLGPRGGEFGEALASYEAQVQASIRNPQPMELLIEFFDGEQLVAAYSGTTLSGGTTVFSVGAETMEVMDYEVEVAQFAAVPDPMVASRFDGMMGLVRATPAADGRVSLVLRAATTWTTTDQSADLGMSLMEGIEQATQGRLFVDERRVLSSEDGSEWTARFGADGSPGPSILVTVMK